MPTFAWALLIYLYQRAVEGLKRQVMCLVHVFYGHTSRMAMLATARLFYFDNLKNFENMKTSTAVMLILIASGIITTIMVATEMDTIGYLFTGRLSATSFLPLVFGVVMSIVVAALKKDDKPED